MNNVEILIISDSLDFTTDFICIELHKRNCKYLRLNRDEFSKYKISFDINKLTMEINLNKVMYSINSKYLISIYFRAPIYLHIHSEKNASYENQLFKSQWTAFIRNLSVFEDVKWMNNPVDTFRGENKLLQLRYAIELGMDCPTTHVINDIFNINIDKSKTYVIKAIDTILLRKEQEEGFLYTNVINGNELLNHDLSLAPFILQEHLKDKVDIRVTVVNKNVFPVKITENGKGIEGDWRLLKDRLEYQPITLPEDIIHKCLQLMSKLNLAFGGIDLVLCNDKYYFIEVNPTGEWAWLIDKTDSRIDYAICDYLLDI